MIVHTQFLQIPYVLFSNLFPSGVNWSSRAQVPTSKSNPMLKP